MKVTPYRSGAAFLGAAGAWLQREEVLNNLMLGIADRLAHADPPPEPPAVLMTAAGPQGLEAALVMTPPRGAVLYAPGIGTDRHAAALGALEALADALQASIHAVPDCHGAAATALAFARLWSQRTGRSFELHRALRIYELRNVTFPAGIPGKARVAGGENLDLLTDWTGRFWAEIGEPEGPQAARPSTERIIAAGQCMLWEVDGRPVSTASAARAQRHGVTISRVYTPPEHRRHGYASACVAALSQRQLDAGYEYCCLYTDLANPTSNAIYQRIGYVPLADASHYRFVQGQGQ